MSRGQAAARVENKVGVDFDNPFFAVFAADFPSNPGGFISGDKQLIEILKCNPGVFRIHEGAVIPVPDIIA